MKDPKIQILVTRFADGQVTKLAGNSGMAVCMEAMPTEADYRHADPPIVSLRCYNEAELAWNLAALMGAVRYRSPMAFQVAHGLMLLCNFGKPLVDRRLPDESDDNPRRW